MISEVGFSGEYEIVIRNSITKEILQRDKIKNRLMNTTLNNLIKAYLGTSSDLQIKYLAVGTSTTAVADTQTQLSTETFRCAPTIATAITGVTGEVKTTFAILDTESKVVIEEIGIFGGAAASASANTGTMISRILWHYDKTVSNIEIQIIRTDKVVRA